MNLLTFPIIIRKMNYFSLLKQKAQSISNKLIPPEAPAVTKIAPQLYHCNYPQSASAFKSMLKQLQSQKIQVWNFSEYEYKNELKKVVADVGGQLHELLYEYYSSMPLTECISAVNKIKEFISESANNCVVVHCQQNKSRSCVFLASYLFLNDEITDVASAIAEVNKKLLVRSNETLYSSQHLILRSIANYHKDPSFINKHSLKLIKVIMNEAPRIPDIQTDESLNIFLEIRKNGQVIYKKVAKQFGQGEIVQFNLKEEAVELEDDCLFSFKYVYGGKAYPVARVQINTNFVFNNFIRVQKQEMDLCKNVKTKGQIFTDFMFEVVEGKQSKLSRRNKKEEYIDVMSHFQKTKETATQDSQSGEQNKESKEEISKDVFHIDEDFGEQKDGLSQKETEEKINEILNNMSMKKVQVQEQIKQVQEESEDEQATEEVNKQTQQLMGQSKAEQRAEQGLAEHKNEQHSAVQQTEQKEQSAKQEAEQKVEPREEQGVKSQQKVVAVESPQKNIQEYKSESSSQDMDDYLSKLQEQADSS